VTGDSEGELDWRVAEMKKLLRSQDLDALTCHFREERAFLSALPLASLDKTLFARSKRNVLTTGAASCYPFTSYEMCDDNGVLLGVNKHNNSLIIIDIFNSRIYKNANIAILGTSGAGKTFTMQLLALRMRRKNIQVFIIAPLKAHEFYRACNNIGGAFIQISPASPCCINVMEIRRSDSAASELIDGPLIEKSLLASKIQRLHIFFSLLIPDMTYEERQLLSFSQQTNVDLTNKYAVLDISKLTGDLLTVGMFVALDFVWDKAKEDRTAEKAIFIDETWQLIGASSNRMAAEFVLEIFKIIRGYGGSAICATQDLNDFFALDDGKYGKGIINNSKTKIILNLEDEEARRVQSVLNLSEAEVMAVTHFQRGSGLISTNNNNTTVEFRSSALELELITSDHMELKSLVERRKQKPLKTFE